MPWMNSIYAWTVTMSKVNLQVLPVTNSNAHLHSFCVAINSTEQMLYQQWMNQSK